MRAPTKRLAVAAISLCTAFPAAVSATNGYFLIGFGAKSRGMGGVGVALPQDGLAAAFNPAGMGSVPATVMRFDVGAELFNPPRSVSLDSGILETESAGPVEHESGSNLFLIPNMGGIMKFNRDLTIGFAAVGAGLGTRFDQTIPGNPTCIDGNTSGGEASTFFNFNCLGSQTVGVSLMQMQMLPSLSYKLFDDPTWGEHTIGASIALGVQMFRAFGLQAFAADVNGGAPGGIGLGFTSGTGANLTNRGNDWSYGAGFRLGWLGRFLDDRVTLGVNYSSKVYMTRFEKYEDLFARGGKFNIPENWSVGISVKPVEKLTVAFDFQRILYGDIDSVANLGPDASTDDTQIFPPGTDVTGSENGLGFGWKDQNVYKLGISYDYNKYWSFRTGANYGDTPIDEDEVLFNMLAPATVQWHWTIGASYRPSPSVEWTVNYMRAFENTIRGRTSFAPAPVPEDQSNAALNMRQQSLGISFSYSL